MQSVGIKELKTNPSIISQAIEQDEYLLISKRGKPIAVATSLDDQVFDHGLKKWILIQAFSKGGLSLGQLASALGQSRTQIIELLNLLHIPVLDYDLEDERDTIEHLM